MMYLAEAGELITVTFSYAAVAAVAGALTYGILKFLSQKYASVDQHFSSKEHHKNDYMSANMVQHLIEATEKRPIVLHAIIKDVPAEMVMRMSTAEAAISKLEIAQVRAAEVAGERYERLMHELSAVREALAGQGFRFDHQKGH